MSTVSDRDKTSLLTTTERSGVWSGNRWKIFSSVRDSICKANPPFPLGAASLRSAVVNGRGVVDWLLLVLRQPVSNVVIIAFVRHKYMNRQLRVSWLVKRAHRDAYPVEMRWVKKQG